MVASSICRLLMMRPQTPFRGKKPSVSWLTYSAQSEAAISKDGLIVLAFSQKAKPTEPTWYTEIYRYLLTKPRWLNQLSLMVAAWEAIFFAAEILQPYRS